jgi:hypothetical protein
MIYITNFGATVAFILLSIIIRITIKSLVLKFNEKKKIS